MIEGRIKSMMRAYQAALHQIEVTGKRSPIALWDELVATFGEDNLSKTGLFLEGNPPPAARLPIIDLVKKEHPPPKQSISQIFFKSFVKPDKFQQNVDKREAKRNKRFERELQIREEFEERREMAREKRFQELLDAIRDEN